MDNNFKQKLQETEFAALKDRYRVILKWATGCGKSKMAIDLINYHVKSIVDVRFRYKILFVVAERAHIKNWEEEFNKWHLNRINTDVDICCYASLKKYACNQYDIVVLDEAHHVFSEKRLTALEEVRNNLNLNNHIYLLSATLSSSKIDTIEEILGRFIVSTVTLKEAIKHDILPDPRVYVVELELDNKTSNQEIKIGNSPNPPIIKWGEKARYIYDNKPCIIKCTEYQKYLHLTNTMEYWKQRYERSKNQFQYNKWVNYGSQRKLYLGNLKTDAVRSLITLFPRKKRYVCFCASVAQAESIDATSTISSKRPTKFNQLVIDQFNEKKLHHIYAVGMITEGMNLTNIQAGVIVQLDGKERLFIQKFGRSLRAKDPVTFIFYYKGTQDEVYLKNALENIDNKYVQYININQLNNIKL